MFMTLSYIIKNRYISTLFGFFISIDRLKHFVHLKLLKLCLALSAYLTAHRLPFHLFSSLKKALELAVHHKSDSVIT